MQIIEWYLAISAILRFDYIRTSANEHSNECERKTVGVVDEKTKKEDFNNKKREAGMSTETNKQETEEHESCLLITKQENVDTYDFIKINEDQKIPGEEKIMAIKSVAVGLFLISTFVFWGWLVYNFA
ncbi:hypothetical protein CDIK_2047 [Cucumispora dikerogammari]|nr:hypothetical protein CDIK_2047 [Cucumispora dikerogammari]